MLTKLGREAKIYEWKSFVCSSSWGAASNTSVQGVTWGKFRSWEAETWYRDVWSKGADGDLVRFLNFGFLGVGYLVRELEKWLPPKSSEFWMETALAQPDIVLSNFYLKRHLLS